MKETMRADPSPDSARWRATHANVAREWLAGVATPWWIAGGWAVDLFVGYASRPHEDLDVGILRKDVMTVLRALPEWEIFEAKDGQLTFLKPGAQPRSDVHSLWCRRTGEVGWSLELMLEESDGEYWTYRRDRRIRRHLEGVITHDSQQTPFLVPEVQLLYQAKANRPKDDADFDLVVHRLSESGRNWLQRALGMTIPTHKWARQLERLNAG
ncbi:MAG: amino acid transporter [Steroidobacteraceae bacterium]|nr:amino acid transporter [Steroidobacteraceae bacterium]